MFLINISFLYHIYFYIFLSLEQISSITISNDVDVFSSLVSFLFLLVVYLMFYFIISMAFIVNN